MTVIFPWNRLFLYSLILLLSFLTSGVSQAGLFDRTPSFLPAQQAFVFSLDNSTQKSLTLHWDITEGYYLYQKELQIIGENVELGEIILPAGELHQDEFFGEVRIYRNNLTIDVPILAQQPQAKLWVTYQGCTQGFCYPPETQEVDLRVWNSPDLTTSAVQNSTIFTSGSSLSYQQLADKLAESKYTSLAFFLFGIGLAFTPCVLPMLPLLSAIVIGQQRPSTLRALALSFTYVQGMALTYTLLGFIVVAIGLPFQIALQHPYVLIALSIVFILLALSMFGVFNLQLPQSWQNKLMQLSQQQKTGAFAGVFVMGIVAGLVASPCTTAPLSAALLYVAQTGDFFIGGITLYLLALGMGLPLILITLFGNGLLPKSGPWLDKVKIIFGFVLLALPVFLLSRLLPDQWEGRLWALLATTFLIWFALQLPNKGMSQVIRIIFMLLAMIAVKPLQDWLWQPTLVTYHKDTQQSLFQSVTNYQQLQFLLAHNNKPLVMLDLYADWCVACKEFEKYTFTDPQVQQKFANMLLLRVDMTRNSKENQELIEKLKVIGLPTILFFDQQGKEIETKRVTGFMPAEQFLSLL